MQQAKITSPIPNRASPPWSATSEQSFTLWPPTDMLRRRFFPTTIARMAASAAASSGGGAKVAAAVAAPVFVSCAAQYGVANVLGFGVSVATGWHYHLDLIGTGVFAVVALSCTGVHLRQRLSAFSVALWAVKLSGFLFYRALQVKHDGRLTDQLSTTKGTFNFWTISAMWGILVSLPHVLAAGVPFASRPAFGLATDVAGLALFSLGLLVETAADYQKWQFKKDPTTSGQFCDVGVWQISQHANWFGNVTLWCGIYLLNLPTLWAGGAARTLGALVSPAFLLALFYAQATDTVTHTRAMADAKYGADANYKKYVTSTPLVLPTPASLARLFG